MRAGQGMGLSGLVLVAFLGAQLSAGGASAQDYSILAHPQPPPQAEDFRQPPSEAGIDWVGPFVNQVGDATCWRVEPFAPSVPVGGQHGIQHVVGFVHLPHELLGERDTGFSQTDMQGLAGGGQQSDLKPGAIPSGFFLTARSHPIFRVTKVELVAKTPFFPGPVLAVFADFWHEPTMGECYFYLAGWIARQQ